MSGLLNGQPASLDAQLQGHHVIPLSQGKVIVRRYHVPVPVEESSDAPVRRGVILETAWREINSSAGLVGDETGGEGVEKGGACAVIDMEGDQATLWIFSAEGIESHVDLSNLEQAGQDEEIDIRKLVTCSTHGNDLECLSPEKKCEVKWTCVSTLEKAWKMFGRGLVEKRAWKEHRRISTVPPFKCDLWPMSTGSLLLKIHPSPIPESTTKTTGTSYLPIVTLSPINSPAIHVGDFDPSPAQESLLDSSFGQMLGSAAMPVRSGWGMEIDGQLGFGQPRWGVYWVCSELSPSSRPSLEEVKGKSGIMAIWPAHLIERALSGESVDDLVDVHRPLPTFDFPTPDSLLDVATSLHDFYAAYNPPTVENEVFDITPETDGPVHIEPHDDDPIPIFSPSSPKRSEGQSDMEDLFGDHSPTPPAQPASEEVAVEVDDTMGLFDMPDLGGDIVMGSPPATDPDGEAGMTMTRPRRIDEETEGVLVTEDDFAFFDSPNDETAGPAEEEETMEQEEKVLNSSDSQGQIGTDVVKIPKPVPTEAPEDAEESLDVPQASTGAVEPDGKTANADNADNADNAAIVADDQSVEGVEEGSNSERQDTSSRKVEEVLAPRKTVTFEQIPLPPSPPSSVIDMVPSPFGPLAISPTIPSFSYALPSPAPSPETFPPLRAELVQRLASESKDQGKYDYAAHWDIVSDQSEMDEEDEYTGAPPTPASFVDTETQPSSITSPQMDPRSGIDDMTWDGASLVGSDLLSLQWDPEALRQNRRVWKDVWAKGKLRVPQVETAQISRLPSTVEYDRLVEEVISNRHLREFLLDNEAGSRATSVVEEDTMLSAFTNGTPLKTISPCQIHVGYSGNVCELSVSALRYWRQLGLQPVGGRKDITALVVCDTSQGDVRAARAFLQRTNETYEACMLGSCEIGTAASAKEGIISIPPSAFVHAISGVLTKVSGNTVIYVLLPTTSPGQLSTLIAELLQSKRAGSEASFTKLIPRSAVEIHSTQDIVFEVYDRICRPTRGTSLRGLPTEPTLPYVQYPSFTLAPSLPLKPELTLAWPLRSYDVLNRWRLVHCAYAIDHDTKRAVGYVVDAQGEAWKSTIFTLGEAGVAGVVEALWGFFKAFAAIASVEYRLAICCVGDLTKTELDAWRALIDASRMPGSLILTSTQVSTPGSSIHMPAPIVPIPPATFADPETRIMDESLTGKTCSLPRIPISLSNSGERVIPHSSFLLNMSTPSEWSTAKFDVLVHRSPPDQEDDPFELFSEQFHRMVVLGRTRHGLIQGVLPLHAEAVRIGLKSIKDVVSLS